MGRKTYESIGKPLDLRNNIVISRQLKDNRVKVYCSLDEAFKHITDNEVFIIGGESIYNSTIDIADEIILMKEGKIEKIGKKEELLGQVLDKPLCCKLGGEQNNG